MYHHIIRNAIDDCFRDYVLKYIDDNIHRFRMNGPGRFDMRHIQDDVINNEKNKLIHKIGIDLLEWEPEPLFGNFIGCNLEGAFVHLHKDPAPYGYTHARINIMINKPDDGGIPIIDNEYVNVNEKDAWICISSKQLHQTNPVIGKKKRLVLSLGTIIKNGYNELILTKK
jgi:hypothetical protein